MLSDNWLDIYAQLDSRGLWLASPWPQRLVVTGGDRKTFLQNFCTNDVVRTAAGDVIEAFFLNTKGHILHHGLLVIREEDIRVYVVGSSALQLAEHLSRYLIREQVELEVVDTPWWIAVGGPWARLTPPQRPDATPADSPGPNSLPESQVYPFPLLHRPAWIVESPLPQERLELSFEQQGYLHPEEESIATVVLDALRIESGLPLPENDYPPGTLPQELDRNQQALHFSKGCYLGQETVARLDALGHVNKLLRGVQFADDTYPYPGIALSQGPKEVGKVTSLSYSPLLGTSLGLAIVRREAASQGTELTWANGTATVTGLPGAAKLET